MHMSDALLSVPVAAGMLGTTLAALAVSAARAADDPRARPARMGVLGAFVFAAQMINFSIPGTGSSGHFAGGTLLALLLGPWAGALVMASVILVQALFFADGGLLAWGANVFNMGLIGCFVAGPLLVGLFAGPRPGKTRLRAAIIAASVAACVAGALCVTLETTASGLTELPFGRFALLMLPVHAAIGVVEGLITALVLERLPQWQGTAPLDGSDRGERLRVGGMAILALLIAGALSWFASQRPDGLEFSVARTAAPGALEAAPGTLAGRVDAWQRGHAPLPDYAFPSSGSSQDGRAPSAPAWPAVKSETSLAGLGGALLVGILALGLGWTAVWRSRRVGRN
jgi:cobalt/nickel transport system permease protein